MSGSLPSKTETSATHNTIRAETHSSRAVPSTQPPSCPFTHSLLDAECYYSQHWVSLHANHWFPVCKSITRLSPPPPSSSTLKLSPQCSKYFPSSPSPNYLYPPQWVLFPCRVIRNLQAAAATLYFRPLINILYAFHDYHLTPPSLDVH